MNPFLNPIVLFIVPVAAIGIVLGVVAAGVKKGTNIFKTQAVAWMITCVMVVCAVGIGLGRVYANPSNEPAPEPGLQQGPGAMPSYVWDNARVLSNRTVRELDERNLRLYERHGAVVGVVTCNYNRDDLYDYTVKQFEAMGLGGGDMLVVLDISGENYGLYAGSSVSRRFSDQDCSDYAYDYMEDFFVREMYDDAVLGLTEALEVWYGENYG